MTASEGHSKPAPAHTPTHAPTNVPTHAPSATPPQPGPTMDTGLASPSPPTGPNEPAMAAPGSVSPAAPPPTGPKEPTDVAMTGTVPQPPHTVTDRGGSDLGPLLWIALLLVAATIGVWWLAQRRKRRDRGSMWPPSSGRARSSPPLDISSTSQRGGTSSLAPETVRVSWKDPATDSQQSPRVLGASGTSGAAPASGHRHGAASSSLDGGESVPAAASARAAPGSYGLDAERTVLSPDSSLVHNVDEILRLVREHVSWHQAVTGHLYERLDDLAMRVSAAPGGERAAPDPRAAASYPPAGMPPAGHDTLERRLLHAWNEFDWEHGTPSLSPIEGLLRDESYDLVEGIIGTYALAVPHRIRDDARAPVYILPLLGKANAHYDAVLFERPERGDSAKLRAAAKVQFIERGVSRLASLERLKAGNEKLNQVFTVVEPGRIE